jgi:histidinol dehydrogenase
MIPLLQWRALSGAERQSALRRPLRDRERLRASAAAIVEAVRSQGDAALRRYTRELDGVDLASFAVTADEMRRAPSQLLPEQLRALDTAIDTVRQFHEAQQLAPLALETFAGVRCERVTVPIRSVGLYVPAGTAPLPSTAIMLSVPAALAGCRERVMCTPPRPDGLADPAVLYVARRCEVTSVYKLGGAQAIAALAYGTAQVPRVDKIFGPGNSWVAAAKELVGTDPEGAAIDLPAGPSEVLVIADQSARAAFVAADLLAQAEHGTDAQVILVTPSESLARKVIAEVERQLPPLPRQAIARQALAAARFLIVEDLAEAFDVSNAYAPEHLILQVERPREWLPRVEAAGSVFLGPWSPETLGDYCSGTNHVLPTGGAARAWSGLSLLDFTRRITVQEVTPDGLRGLGPTAHTLARLEGLQAHANAVELRLQALGGGSGAR